MISTISVDNVSKSFFDFKKGEIRVLSHIFFQAMKGQILGIIGPNGAGKTTLLRLVAALISPTEGEISILGKPNRENAQENRRKIGFISSDTALYDRLTAEEMIYYNGKLCDMEDGEIQSRLKYLTEVLNIGKILKNPCRNLSTGEKQKVSIARTLIHDPEILILDEPTNGLDLVTGRDILWMIRQSRQEEKTILYSAHNMEEIEKICDRILLLYQGEKIEEGTVREVTGRHGSEDLTECFFKIIEERENRALPTMEEMS